MDKFKKLVDIYSQFVDVEYDYAAAVLEDVEQFLDDNSKDIIEQLKEFDYDRAVEAVVNNLREEDDITGNASGSYTYNRFKAKACVLSAIDEVPDILGEMYASNNLNKLIGNGDWEIIDVIIRLYKFGEVYHDIVDMIKEKFPEESISEN